MLIFSSLDMASNFQKQPESKVDSLNSPYDYLSIMHYQYVPITNKCLE